MNKTACKVFSLTLVLLIVLSLVPMSSMAFANEEVSTSIEGDTLRQSEESSHESDEGSSGDLEEGIEGEDTTPAFDDAEDEEAIEAPEDDEEGVGVELLANAVSLLATLAWTGNTPPVVAPGDVITLSGTPSGTLTVPAGATVTINGTVAGTKGIITLNIQSGAKVLWNASLQGALTRAADSLVNVSGGGTLEFSHCTVVNTGTGGTVNINGANTTMVVGSGATIASDGASGNAVLVSANYTTL